MRYQYRHISAADANTTVLLVNNTALLAYITINKGSSQDLTVKDGLGQIVAVLAGTVIENTFTYRVDCPKGIAIDVPAGYDGDATISFV